MILPFTEKLKFVLFVVHIHETVFEMFSLFKKNI